MTTKIQHTWIPSRNACTMIIDKEIALKHGLTDPDHISVESTKDGILIRRREEADNN